MLKPHCGVVMWVVNMLNHMELLKYKILSCKVICRLNLKIILSPKREMVHHVTLSSRYIISPVITTCIHPCKEDVMPLQN